MSENVEKTAEPCPEESRFALLADALKQATNKITSILSQKAFMESFPQMKKRLPDTLIQLHSTFTEKVVSRLNEGAEELLEELQLKQKLDFLDQMESEQLALSQGETVWRPTGVPSKDLLAYDVPALLSHRDELVNYRKELQKQNEEKKKQLSNLADEIRNTEKLIEEQLQKNESTFDLMSSIYS